MASAKRKERKSKVARAGAWRRLPQTSPCLTRPARTPQSQRFDSSLSPEAYSYKAPTSSEAWQLWPSLCEQDSIGTKSAPVAQTPLSPRKGANGLPSPAKSLERSQSAEDQKPKIKPPALNNLTSEATSTMSPPPAKKLALSAKKVTVSSRIIQS